MPNNNDDFWLCGCGNLHTITEVYCPNQIRKEKNKIKVYILIEIYTNDVYIRGVFSNLEKLEKAKEQLYKNDSKKWIRTFTHWVRIFTHCEFELDK